MAAFDSEIPVKPSVHDRLLGRSQSGDSVYTVERCRRDILRDVRDLLNTRTPFVPPVKRRFPAAAESILTFGRPELALISIQQDMAQFAQKIKDTILRFDPRFQHVDIEILGQPSPTDRTLRLRIRARLRLSPVNRLEFDSEMDFGTGQFQLKRLQ